MMAIDQMIRAVYKLDKCDMDRRAEFTKRYAERLWLTTDEVRDTLGLTAVPCECGLASCDGWRMDAADLVEDTIIRALIMAESES